MSKTPPSPSLRVTCVQTDAPCAPHDLTALLDDAATRRPADLYLLPELCTVPYLSTAEVLRARAETVDGPTASALCRWTAAHDAVVLAGLVERGEHGLHNSVLVVDAGRVRGLYRKRHLTRYEKGLFLPGTENGLFQIRGHLVGIMVCFDLWFPETGRNLLRRGARLFCAPAAFGGPQTARLAALRALENLTPLAYATGRVQKKPGTWKPPSGAAARSTPLMAASWPRPRNM
ncbi:carbon-nitrogen hydrolase family protein [Desulfovibrio sp.]|uniref:carbon-nitrogen hydrolase family protein n=1 Tax=Desulfovibrio sp. TaxID=885 RepID=UPI003AB82AB8